MEYARQTENDTYLNLDKEGRKRQIGFNGGANGLGAGIEPLTPNLVHWLESSANILEPNLSRYELALVGTGVSEEFINFGENPFRLAFDVGRFLVYLTTEINDAAVDDNLRHARIAEK